MKAIRTAKAPTPAGHYSQAIAHSGLLYVAGQVGIDRATPDRPAGTIEEQTEQALENMSAILDAAGSGLGHVLQITVFVSGMDLWDQVNTVCARVMGDHRPARAIVPVSNFKNGLLVEVQAIAAVA